MRGLPLAHPLLAKIWGGIIIESFDGPRVYPDVILVFSRKWNILSIQEFPIRARMGKPNGTGAPRLQEGHRFRKLARAVT